MSEPAESSPQQAQAAASFAVEVVRLHPDAVVPRYATGGDAGADLVTVTGVVLQPGERAVLGTGLAIAIPAGYAGFVHPRSGLAARAGLGLLNAPGTIDAGYRGEVKIIVINHDPIDPIVIEAGDRVAQLVIQAVQVAEFRVVGDLPDSARGTGGLGSTGGAGALGAHPDTLVRAPVAGAEPSLSWSRSAR